MAHYCLTRTLIEIATVIDIDAPYAMTREYLGKFSGAYMALYYTGAITSAEVNFYAEIESFIFNEITDYYFKH